MTFENDLVQLGEFAQTAKVVSGGKLDSPASLVGSTGTDGATTGSSVGAYQINKDVTFVNAATSSTAGNAAILPKNRGAGYITVFNNTAFSIYVFAPVGGTINNFATTGLQTNLGTDFHGAFQIAANKSATMMSADGNAWLSQHAG